MDVTKIVFVLLTLFHNAISRYMKVSLRFIFYFYNFDYARFRNSKYFGTNMLLYRIHQHLARQS